MPSAIHMVCQLYNTAIQSNAGWLYGSLVVQSSYTNATCCRPSIWCAGCIIMSYRVHCWPVIWLPGCTIILYHCHIPSAVHMVCQLYNTAIQFNAGRLHCFLVVQPSYTNATCRRPSIWCASCIILPYSPMPAGCMVPWLYNHLIPMPHAIGHLYVLPAVEYCYIIQCQLVVWYASCTLHASHSMPANACRPFHTCRSSNAAHVHFMLPRSTPGNTPSAHPSTSSTPSSNNSSTYYTIYITIA
jgi:hypothetical protein